MTRGLTVVLAIVLALAGIAEALPKLAEPQVHPGTIPAEPSYVRLVEPAIVGLRVRADETAFSSNRLGSRRFGSGIIFHRDGYVLTVSYIVLDAVSIEAVLRDGRVVPARLVGIDLESGLGVVKLDGAGPWPAATLGQSTDAARGMLTATIGVDEDNELVYVTGAVQAVRRFSSFWEYMLDRALLIQPASSSWGGSAVVDTAGNVIGVSSLRIGEAPYVNLAIPIEQFVPVMDELISVGRVVSRRPRPWLGLYTAATTGGVVVEGVAPVGPAASAGFRKGDRIVSVNGVTVDSQEHFYQVLWRGQAGDVVRIAVQRGGATHVIAVASIDHYRLLRSAPR